MKKPISENLMYHIQSFVDGTEYNDDISAFFNEGYHHLALERLCGAGMFEDGQLSKDADKALKGYSYKQQLKDTDKALAEYTIYHCNACNHHEFISPESYWNPVDDICPSCSMKDWENEGLFKNRGKKG